MNRPRFAYLVIVGVLAVAVAMPALGVHIQEPTAPVVETRLQLGQYPNIRGTELLCDGSDVVEFTLMRIQLWAVVESTPSEHWEWVFLLEGSNHNTPNGEPAWTKQWRSTPKHANVPPHHGKVWEVDQIDQELGQYDLWRATYTLVGSESGNTFTHVCVFSEKPDLD